MIFLSFVNLYIVQKSEKVKLFYKLSSDDKISSSIITSQSLQGSKWEITIRSVSIGSALFLFVLK